MRRLLVALGLLGGLLSPALAADYDLPILRGSQALRAPAPARSSGLRLARPARDPARHAYGIEPVVSIHNKIRFADSCDEDRRERLR